jgi:putative intracellular protease/amidase
MKHSDSALLLYAGSVRAAAVSLFIRNQTMRAYVLQHAPFEEPGNILHWLQQQQAETHYCRLYAGDPLPLVDELDLLIVLGGPMSVNDEADYPWLKAEKAFLAQVIAAEKPVVGICLGAQLIAACQGARIYANHSKEIGWFDITGCLPRAMCWHYRLLSRCSTGMVRPLIYRRAQCCWPAAKPAPTRSSSWGNG